MSLNRPWWLDIATYTALLEREQGAPRCRACAAEKRLFDLADPTIDHVLPRSLGGGNELSNLQILCRVHNSRKGTRPDDYWGRQFYFDREPNLANLRTMQRELGWNAITERYADWFARPASDIAGLVHVVAAVVGAGKTVLIPVFGWALNHAIRARMHGAAVPRVDRILVLTKDQALRDQLCRSLGGDAKTNEASDLVRYGIVATPPRVRCIDSSDQLKQGLGNLDIAVACVAMLFGTNGHPHPDLPQILANYGAIVFDEVHFAHAQVRQIVAAASASVCFGTTGSPLNPDGEPLEGIVLVGVYGYQDAVNHDQSLKFLSPDVGAHIEELDVKEAALLEPFGERSITSKSESADYPNALVPQLSIGQRLLRAMSEADGVPVLVAAAHRPEDSVVALRYPMHALLKAASREEGRILTTTMNDWLETRRDQFPLADGFRCDLVVTGDDDHPGQPLLPTHPFFAAWRALREDPQHWDGRLPSGACRLLVVVGIGREGMDNPLIGAVGIGYPMNSMIEGIQRPYGRQMRGVQVRLPDGRLAVPPEPLDRVRLFVHSAHNNRRLLERCGEYLLTMQDAFKDLTTIDELLEGAAPTTVEGVTPQGELTSRERYDLLGKLFDEADPEDIVDDVYPESSRERARDWLRQVIDEPERAAHALGLDAALRRVEIVAREYLLDEPDVRTMREFIAWHSPELDRLLLRLDDPDIWSALVAVYREYLKTFRVGTLQPTTSLQWIRHDLVTTIQRQLGVYFEGEVREIHKLVGTAVFSVLGDRSATKDSQWETPTVHARLRRRDCQHNIQGWVIGRLIAKGLCPRFERLGEYVWQDETEAVA
ncbi:MAG TPA: HNH endonuclease [Chloroflexota bacterium]|nr:HNH endonuclease [Chloroflexota bacterium]